MEYKSSAVSPIESISKGWEIIKDNYWMFLGMNVVMILIIIVAAIILGLINNGITFGISAVLGVASQGVGEAGQVTSAVIPQFISMFISLFTNIIVFTLSGMLTCGIYKALSRTSRGEIADFGDLFSGFQYFMPCLLFAVVYSAIQFIIGVVTALIAVVLGVSALGVSGMITPDGQLNPGLFGGIIVFALLILLFSTVLNLIISALTTFVYPLISERGMSGGEALSYSIKSGFSNIFGLILLLILLGLMFLGGFFLCVIGIFFVAPIMTASIYAAFNSVFGETQDSLSHTPPSPPTFGEQPSY